MKSIILLKMHKPHCFYIKQQLVKLKTYMIIKLF